jgi:hypothetical protein
VKCLVLIFASALCLGCGAVEGPWLSGQEALIYSTCDGFENTLYCRQEFLKDFGTTRPPQQVPDDGREHNQPPDSQSH